jgi:hypothetical protein
MILISCGNDENPTENKKATWINNAFNILESNAYPNLKAISWWHENFDNSLLKINSSSESLDAYKNGINSATFTTTPNINSNKLIVPVSGIYHAAFPDFGGTEDVVSAQKIIDFERLVNKDIVWTYFSNNWYNDIQFPSSEVAIIHSENKIPFIRMMPRTNFDEGGPDPNYTMQKIIDGDFDTELIQWSINAANTGFPLLVEFGTEVNGNWFPWNGQYNGNSEMANYGDPLIPDGPERFKDAYKHIIDICNTNNATNITWFFHVNAYDEPELNWNTIENYYPGDDYIDWLGVSIYGPQEPNDDYQEFSEILNAIYPSLTSLSDKPIAILEFAITEL